MPAQTFRASGQSFTSCVTVCFPRDARPPPLEAPGAEGLLSLALLCALPVPVVYCGPQVVALCLGNRRRGRCRARASIAVLSPLFCARRARARASQCRCACYAYFVLTYGNSVCGRIRHRMSAGGARTPRTRVFFASVVGNVSVIGNRISVIARFGYRPRAPLNIPTSPHGLCAQVQDVCYPPHQQSHVSHTQHAPGPGAITKKVATPMRTGKACR